MPEHPIARIFGVCARTLDANRWSAFAALGAIAVAGVGWFTAGLLALPIAALLGAALVLAIQSPQPLEIGSDGLAFAGRPASFLSFADIVAIEEINGAALLRCADGRRLRLVGPRRSGLEPATLDRLRALVLRHWREARPPIALPPRGESSLAQWFESIRATRAAHEREALLASVEDPALPALVRATAALLLRNQLTQDERRRIGTAAQSTVAVRLRAALDLIAVGTASETAMLSALEALLPNEPRSQKLLRAIATELAGELSRALATYESSMRSAQDLVARVVARAQSESSVLVGVLRKH
jgi:hypothetical protein